MLRWHSICPDPIQVELKATILNGYSSRVAVSPGADRSLGASKQGLCHCAATTQQLGRIKGAHRPNLSDKTENDHLTTILIDQYNSDRQADIVEKFLGKKLEGEEKLGSFFYAN